MTNSTYYPLRKWVAGPRTRKYLRLGVFWIAAMVLLAGPVSAQISSSISGTVRDTTGAVIPGAKVTLTNEASKSAWSAVSNGVGFFSFPSIQAATYSLQVFSQSFETWKVTGIVVHPGDSMTVPKIMLKLGRADVSVVVTAESAGITLSSGEHSTLITAADINRLATQGRDVTELLNMLPGFTINAGSSIQNEGPGGLYGFQTMGPGNSSTLENSGADGAAPQQGEVNLTSDGANVIDPGDMAAQVSNVNMSQVQEVKVETADFGADQAKGPIVIDAVGKSGSAQFHGSLYGLYRNSALNSNDWLSKYFGAARPPNLYYYPGATLGGPVLIPHSDFNHNKHLVFWVGFEDYRQNQTQGLATAFVPTNGVKSKYNPSGTNMLGGDLSYATLASALNVPEDEIDGTAADSQGGCKTDYQEAAKFTEIGGNCTSPPNGNVDLNNNPIYNGQIPGADIDPAYTTFSKFFPAPNRTPQPVITAGTTQFLSDGQNWDQNVMQSSNGFQLHSRIDESITDTLKFYAVWNWEDVNGESPMNDIYYNPPGTIPYPSPEYSHGHAHYLTLDLTKTFGASLTNDLMVSGVYYMQPKTFADPAKVQTTGTAWQSEGYDGGHNHTGTQLPEATSYESTGIPGFAFGYVGPAGEYLRKFDWNISDNVTKVYKTHTFKAGFYTQLTGNSNNTQGSQENGAITWARWGGCYINQPAGAATASPPNTTGMDNTVANFLIGCTSGYAQADGDPVEDERFGSVEGYVTDDWKVNSQLTLTLGIRLSHLEPWRDAHGVGMAVWDPTAVSSAYATGVMQHVVYSTTSANTTWPGITWHQRNAQFPNAGVPTEALFYAPRFGLAYDFYGNGKTVFRGGWGMYYSHDSANVGGGALTTSLGLETYSPPGTVNCSLGQLFTTKYVPCGNYATTSAAETPFGIYAMNPKDNKMPLTYNYNFTLDQQGPWNSTFEISYVGNQSPDLATLTAASGTNLTNQNVIPLGAQFGPDPVLGEPQSGEVQSPTNITNYSDYRPYPNYTYVDVPNHIAWANYNALQTSWNRQRGALIYGANYTWSKAMAVRGNYDTGNISDPINPHHDYGTTSFNRPQAFNLTYSYQEGTKYNGNHLLGQVVNGWEISGIMGIQSGPNLALWNGTNFGLSGSTATTSTTTELPSISGSGWLGSEDYTLQPNVMCDPRANLKKDQYVNGNCFALPTPGTQGWWNLPEVHGPAYFKWDMSVYKDFAINDRQHMQFQVSGFNWLNHPLVSFYNQNSATLDLIAGDPAGSTYSSSTQAAQAATITNTSTFGSTDYKTGVRIVELGFKYTF